MFTSVFNASVKSTLVVAVFAAGLSMSPATAGDGGGGGDRAQGTVSNTQVGGKNSTRDTQAPLIIPVPTVWESILFPGPMPGGRTNDR